MDPDVSLDTVAKTILPHDLREVWTFVGYTAVSLMHNCESHPLQNSVYVLRSISSSRWKGQLAVSAETGAPDCRGRG